MTTNILELPEVLSRISPLSVEEYHQLGEYNQNHRRTELIRGIIIEKVSRSPLHGSIAKRLYDRLLGQAPEGYIVRKDEPLTLTDSEPEPDISVVRGSAGDFWEAHPRTASLVVEVAVTSVQLDRAMASVYAENGVSEYWIVLPRQQAVEVYRELRNGLYADKSVYVGDQEVVCSVLPEIRVVASDLFAPDRA